MSGYLNARQAAALVGYTPQPERDADGKRIPARTDPAMRAFYAFISRHQEIRRERWGSNLRFLRSDLDAAVHRFTEDRENKLERMETLARRHAAGESIHG